MTTFVKVKYPLSHLLSSPRNNQMLETAVVKKTMIYQSRMGDQSLAKQFPAKVVNQAFGKNYDYLPASMFPHAVLIAQPRPLYPKSSMIAVCVKTEVGHCRFETATRSQHRLHGKWVIQNKIHVFEERTFSQE